MPPILIAILFEVGLLALAAALGRRLLRALAWGPSDRLERAVIGTTLGLGALQVLPFALYSVGLGRPDAFRIATAVLAVALLPDLVAVARASRALAAELAGATVWERVLVGVFAGALCLVFVRAQCPIVDGDALAYHLVAAQRWLAAGRFYSIPTIPYTNWPMSTEAIASALFALSPNAPPGILQFTFGILATWAAYLLGRRIHGAVAGLLAVILMVAYARYTGQFVTLHVELATCAYLTCLALTLAGMRHAPGEWKRGPQMAATFAGLIAATKLNGLWAIPLTVCVAFSIGQLPLGARVRRALHQTLIGLAVVAPWIVRCWLQTGNPICPGFYGLFGGRGWTAEGAERFYFGHRLFCVIQAFGTSHHAIVLQHAALAGIGLGLAAAAFWKTRRSSQAEPARLLFGCVAALCIGGYVNTRFAMPALPCLAVCLVGWTKPFGRRLVPWLCLVAILLLVRTVAELPRPGLALSWAYATGRIGRDRWYRSILPEDGVIRWANQHIPDDSRVLAGAYEKRIALFRSEALWSDSLLQDEIHYDSAARFETDLRRLRVAYLFLCRDWPAGCRRNLYCAARRGAELALQEDLARRRGTLLYEEGPARLYRLNWAR